MTMPLNPNSQQKALITAWEMAKQPITPEFIERVNQLGTKSKAKAVVAAKTEGVAVIREAEAVLLSLDFPNSIKKVICKGCGRVFGTNYNSIRHCSNDCLKLMIEKMGLTFDPEKPQDSYYNGTNVPLVIKPESMDKLKKWATYILGLEVKETPDIPQTEPQPEPIAPKISRFDSILALLEQ